MITIRSLQPDQWRTYRDVRLAALQDAPDAFGGSYAQSAALDEPSWRQRCTEPSWFAFDDDQPIGMVRVWCPDGQRLPHLISMWVAPAARGSGVAPDLVQRVLDWAQELGHPGVTLCVIDTNHRARALYERCGFRAIGPCDTLPDGRVEVIMEHRFAGGRPGRDNSEPAST